MSAATDAAFAAVQGYKQLDPTQATTQANQQYDVAGNQTRLSALQGSVANLQSSLDAVDPSVTGRTSGTFTTEGQRSALVGKEQTPIAANLSKANSAEAVGENALSHSENLASSMATALLSGDKEKYNQLLDVYNASSAADKQANDQAEQKIADQQNAQKLAASSSSGSGTSAKTSALSSLNDDIISNVAAYKNQPAFWTEKTLIPALVAAYPELTPKQITDQVYALRKQYE